MKDIREYNIAAEETYQDGQVIFEQGSSGDWIYCILSGSVEISKSIEGRKHVFEILKPGEVFGELGFIGGIRRTATACAVGETTLGVVDREFLEKEFNQLSGGFRTILGSIVLRFEKMLDRAHDFRTRTEPRVPKVLSLKLKDRQAFIQAYSANLSASGLFIRTDSPFDTGEMFLLQLPIPETPSVLKVKCRVIWNRNKDDRQPETPPGMGVKFCEVSKNDHQLLKEYLTSD
ncbi:MAG: TIGR02266 family protein [Thermodesulfobacteriota bacterium]|nr:TIGR02266 family protein [Thermodesulfobacteriota bacterium]